MGHQAEWIPAHNGGTGSEVLFIDGDPKVRVAPIGEKQYLVSSIYFTGTYSHTLTMPDMLSAKREAEKLLRDSLSESNKKHAQEIIHNQEMLESLIRLANET